MDVYIDAEQLLATAVRAALCLRVDAAIAGHGGSQVNLHAPADMTIGFPPGFVWGVATSAFQIEGAAIEDGKGLSIWDQFCQVPGAIADGSDGDIACDHYHRWSEDLDLVAGLGVNAYRFSVSWPRVRPDGDGAWNEKGLDFYERMVDGLLARGIKPYVTLNHWDLPAELQAHSMLRNSPGLTNNMADSFSAVCTCGCPL